MTERKLLDAFNAGRTVRQVADGPDPAAAAIARGSAAAVAPFRSWFVAEVAKGTTPEHLAAAFNEIVGSALAGLLEHMREQGHVSTIDESIAWHVNAIGDVAHGKLLP